MIILCDTSSILMLLRIEPKMFMDERYGCVTIKEVFDEITQTTKFKSKYPWLADVKAGVKPLPASKTTSPDVKTYLDAIKQLIKVGTEDDKTGHLFDLSRVDMTIAACALALGHSLTSGDKSLVRFMEQEFQDDFKSQVYPLGIINAWLQKGLIKWDDVKQEYLAEWSATKEPSQPDKEIKKFRRLTGRKYPGS